LVSASVVLAQDAKMRNGASQSGEFYAQPPKYDEFYAQQYGPYSLPAEVIIRNPEGPAMTAQEKRSLGRVPPNIF
jgi:hypothetical protein